MRNPSFAVMFLLLRIAYGSSEKGEELPPSGCPPIVDCHFAPGECTQKEESLRHLCSRLVAPCRTEIDCNSRIVDCFNALSESCINETPRKRNSPTKNSFLFLKFHPVLHRAADPNLMNVPTRYRRIGVRLGSEFLGKRSGVEEEGVRRGRRLPGTELLGKRHGSEMLGKRNVEMLGKRGGEFLGERNGRAWPCGDEEDCHTKGLPRVLVQYFKVADGTEVDNPETENESRSSPPDRWQPTDTNSLYFLEKL